MLVITYCAALCASVACWKIWRRRVENIAIGTCARRVLVSGYWLLALTLLVDLLASLSIANGELSQSEFKLVLVIAVGTMPQVALFAFVLTPVVMQRGGKEYSFTRAVVFMECCAIISVIMFGTFLFGLLLAYRKL